MAHLEVTEQQRSDSVGGAFSDFVNDWKNPTAQGGAFDEIGVATADEEAQANKTLNKAILNNKYVQVGLLVLVLILVVQISG